MALRSARYSANLTDRECVRALKCNRQPPVIKPHFVQLPGRKLPRERGAEILGAEGDVNLIARRTAVGVLADAVLEQIPHVEDVLRAHDEVILLSPLVLVEGSRGRAGDASHL